MSAGSFLAACLAAGSTVAALEWALAAPGRSAFALVRPPGHHALRARAGGFCIFNNLGIAARHGLARLGLERILVLDWDVHHGNALEDLFYEDPRFSTSPPLSPSYPHTRRPRPGRGPAGATPTTALPSGRRAEVVAHYRGALPLLAGSPPGHLVPPLRRPPDDPLSNAGTRGAFGLLAASIAIWVGGASPWCSLEGCYHLPALVAAVRAVFHGLLRARESAWRFHPPRAAGCWNVPGISMRLRPLVRTGGGVPPAGEAGRRAEARQ